MVNIKDNLKIDFTKITENKYRLIYFDCKDLDIHFNMDVICNINKLHKVYSEEVGGIVDSYTSKNSERFWINKNVEANKCNFENVLILTDNHIVLQNVEMKNTVIIDPNFINKTDIKTKEKKYYSIYNSIIYDSHILLSDFLKIENSKLIDLKSANGLYSNNSTIHTKKVLNKIFIENAIFLNNNKKKEYNVLYNKILSGVIK